MQEQITDPTYYCHICACEVSSTVNEQTQETECSECSSNFIELLGQGVEIFITGPAIPPCIQQPGATEGDAIRRRERRRSEPTRLPERITGPFAENAAFIDSNGSVRHHQNVRLNMINRTPQLHSNGHPTGVFTSSTVGMGSNSHSSDSRTMPSPIELGSLMSAFMMGRTVPDNAGNNFLGYAGNAGRTFEDFLHHIFMNENSHAGEPPATERIIESLKRTVVSSSADILELGECSISQESFELGDVSIRLPCKHSYKEDPIIHWLKMHNTCPVCRIPLSAVDTSSVQVNVDTVDST